MKTKFLSAIALGATVMLSSCDKEVESTSLQIDLAHKAPVKGYVYAEMDKTKAGIEFAPEGTKLVLSINYSDFEQGGAGKWIDTVKVDANGTFTAMVPVDDNGVFLRIDPIIFEANQVQEYNANSTTRKKIYSASFNPTSISTSSNLIVEITYDDDDLSNYVDFASVTYTIEAELDLSMSGLEKVVGKEVTLYVNENNFNWMQKFTTDANGNFTAQVPSGKNIRYDILFTSEKKVQNPDDASQYILEAYEYKVENGNAGSFSSTSEQDLNVGGGEKVEE